MVDERVRLLAACRSVHRRNRARDPASAVFALLDESHARPGAREHQRAVHELLAQGMVLNEIFFRKAKPPRRVIWITTPRTSR